MYLLILAKILLLITSPDQEETVAAAKWLALHCPNAIVIFFGTLLLSVLCCMGCLYRVIPHTRGGLAFTLLILFLLTFLFLIINQGWADLWATSLLGDPLIVNMSQSS